MQCKRLQLRSLCTISFLKECALVKRPYLFERRCFLTASSVMMNSHTVLQMGQLTSKVVNASWLEYLRFSIKSTSPFSSWNLVPHPPQAVFRPTQIGFRLPLIRIFMAISFHIRISAYFTVPPIMEIMVLCTVFMIAYI